MRRMISLRTIVPSPPLSDFVRIYAERRVNLAPSAAALIEPIPARLEQMLEFQIGAPFIVNHCEGFNIVTPGQAIIGAQTSGCSRIELGSGVISFGVFFRPTGLSRLLDIPVSEFTGRAFNASSVFKLFDEVRERLLSCSSFEQRVRHVESVLLRLAAGAKKRNSIVEVAEHIFSRRGAIRISDVASQTALSLRQFQRNFIENIGIAPKLFARVARFQSALDAKIASPQRAWLEIAHDLQYHDQMHMIHDFQRLGGAVPTQLLPRIGDARPVAVLSENIEG
jgi:AraC-like DNA-binding protein